MKDSRTYAPRTAKAPRSIKNGVSLSSRLILVHFNHGRPIPNVSKRCTFIDRMSLAEADKYRKYWGGMHDLTGGPPFGIKTTVTKEGELTTITTFDEYGRPHRQYGHREGEPRMNMGLPIRKCLCLELELSRSEDLEDQLDQMNKYTPIESVVGRLKNEFDWTHSFIRECYFASEHCMHEFIDDSGKDVIGDVSGPLHARVIVAAAGSSRDSGIEFLFCNVSVFSVEIFDELSFDYAFDLHAGHSIQFSSANDRGSCRINAEKINVRFLGMSYRGISTLLGFEMPNEIVYESFKIEGSWRQCAKCHNIWENDLSIEFARCPDCGMMTRVNNTMTGGNR